VAEGLKMARASRKTVEELTAKIEQEARRFGFDGQQWTALAEVLNHAGILNTRGNPWKAGNIMPFYQRNIEPRSGSAVQTAETSSRSERKETRKTTEMDATDEPEHPSEEPTTVLGQFDEEALNDLNEILAWWRERKEAGKEAERPKMEIRPDFKRGGKGATVTRSVRIGKALAKSAEKKAKQEKALTGGSFSGLVEFLLWDYLGRDERFLETE